MKHKRQWILSSMFTVSLLLYYLGDIANHFNLHVLQGGIFDTVHDLHRTLFLAPIFYASYHFRLKGAIVASTLTFILFLPRAFYFSFFPNPLIRAFIFSASAFVISFMMALVLNERDREKKLAVMLRESENRYRTLIESTRDLIFTTDEKGFLTYLNPQFERALGYVSHEWSGKNFLQIVASDDIDRLKDIFRRSMKREFIPVYEADLRRIDGTKLPVEFNVTTLLDEEGKPTGRYGIGRDITERRWAEQALREREMEYHNAFEQCIDAIFWVDVQTEMIIDCNLAAANMIGLPRDKLIGQHRAMLHPPEFKEFYAGHFRRHTESGSNEESEAEVISTSGQRIPVLISATRLKLGNRGVLQGIFRDITALKRMEEKLHSISLTDELTGLYNRRGFITLSHQQIKMTERTKKEMLLFFVDLDKMKQINDTLGHQEGDNALVETAAILKKAFRDSDIIGRMGGDEFAILAIDTTEETREILVNRLHNALDTYNKLENRKHQLSLSIGISRYDAETPLNLDELIAQADTSMYEEKKRKQK